VTPDPHVHALILAGGASRRMGEPKLLLPCGESSLLGAAVARARSVCAHTWVVVGAYAPQYVPEARRAGAAVVENLDWAEGLASSLRAGVAALPPSAAGALVVLPDQPFVPAAHLAALLARFREGGRPLVLSRYPDGALGVPAVVGAALFGAVARLTGEAGARKLTAGSGATGNWHAVPLSHPEDIDTPEDARRLLGAQP
jgi:molybdenum cofactor cytidylyltransferase